MSRAARRRDSVAANGRRGRGGRPGDRPDAADRAIQARNWRLVQVDSLFIGIVNASSTFLPVFLLRLGASANDVGLLTALPALTAFLLAIPFGRMLQARGRIVALVQPPAAARVDELRGDRRRGRRCSRARPPCRSHC